MCIFNFTANWELAYSFRKDLCKVLLHILNDLHKSLNQPIKDKFFFNQIPVRLLKFRKISCVHSISKCKSVFSFLRDQASI